MRPDELAIIVASGALRPLRPRCWSVLLALALEHPRRPTAKRLGQITGMSVRNVERAIIELQAAELLPRKIRRRRRTDTATLPGLGMMPDDGIKPNAREVRQCSTVQTLYR